MLSNISNTVNFLSNFQQKIEHYKRSFTDMDYQEGCAKKVSSVVAKTLIGVGGVSVVVAGAELFFRFNITLNPFSTFVTATGFATITCLGGYCLRSKVNHERAQAEQQYTQLRGEILGITQDESNKITLSTQECLEKLDDSVQVAGKQIEQRSQTITQMEETARRIQETVIDLRGINQEVPQVLDLVNNRIALAEQQNQEFLDALEECDAFLEEQNRKKKNNPLQTAR